LAVNYRQFNILPRTVNRRSGDKAGYDGSESLRWWDAGTTQSGAGEAAEKTSKDIIFFKWTAEGALKEDSDLQVSCYAGLASVAGDMLVSQ